MEIIISSSLSGCSCPNRKIRIPMASLEDTNLAKRVEEDRSNAIEAATVRIMKVISFEYNSLVSSS